jgi:SPP1 family predicted phage head-tail adaptor
MSIEKMNTFIDLITTEVTKDSEGFSTVKDTIIASVRAYKEDRYASEKWANMAAFSEANALFRFRRIPDVEVSTAMVIVCNDGRYKVTSVMDIKNRGMYIEVLAKKVVESSG